MLSKEKLLPKEKLEIFKRRVNNGQSLKMLIWEFKIPEKQIKDLCKEYGLVLHTTDELRYVNKLQSAYHGIR